MNRRVVPEDKYSGTKKNTECSLVYDPKWLWEHLRFLFHPLFVSRIHHCATFPQYVHRCQLMDAIGWKTDMLTRNSSLMKYLARTTSLGSPGSGQAARRQNLNQELGKKAAVGHVVLWKLQFGRWVSESIGLTVGRSRIPRKVRKIFFKFWFTRFNFFR